MDLVAGGVPLSMVSAVAGSPLPTARSETFPYPQHVLFYQDIPLVYFDVGQGPALVLVHALGANLTHFEHVAPGLVAAGYRVCGLDLPGFGLSGKPDRPYSIRYLTGGVLALLDHLGLPAATFCGHSLGGLVCADAALSARARVQRLVLISSAGLFRLPLPLRLAARTLMTPELLSLALERNARRLLELVFEERNERTRRFMEQSLTRPDPRFAPDLGRVLAALRDDLTSYHLHDCVERLSMPTLVLWGGRDRLLPVAPVPAWSSRLPLGHMEVIERCGHMPIIEQPEPVVSSIAAFLSRPATRPARVAPVTVLER